MSTILDSVNGGPLPLWTSYRDDCEESEQACFGKGSTTCGYWWCSQTAEQMQTSQHRQCAEDVGPASCLNQHPSKPSAGTEQTSEENC